MKFKGRVLGTYGKVHDHKSSPKDLPEALNRIRWVLPPYSNSL